MQQIVAQKCPNLTESTSKVISTLIDTYKCSDWTTIDKTDQLNPYTENEVRCLIFYEGLTAFCTKSDAFTSPYVELKVSTTELCSDFVKVIQALDVDHPFIKKIDSSGCEKICLDPFSKKTLDICNNAYFFSSRFLQLDNELNKKTETAERPPSTILSNADQKTGNKADEPAEKSNISQEKPKSDLENPKSTNQEVVVQKTDISTNEKPSSIKKEPKPENTKVESQIPDKKPENPPVKPSETNVKPVEPSGDAKIINNESSVPKPEHSEVKTVAQQSKVETSKNEEENAKKTAASLNENEQTNIERQQDVDDAYQKTYEDDDDTDKDVVPEATKPKKMEKAEIHALPVDDSVVSEKLQQNIKMDGDSSFFSYFMVTCLFVAAGYVGYHNRQKIFALVLEGRRGRRQSRSRRPNSANYRKLDSNLEEAISSSCKIGRAHV